MANSEGLFRKSALKKLSSPEQLDQTISIIKLRGWIGLCALGALLVCVFVWSIVGSIPEKVSGNGILMNSNGLLSVTYDSDGVVTGVFFESGEKVFKGQVIVRIERKDLMEQIHETSHKLADLQKRYETERHSLNAQQLLSLKLQIEEIRTQMIVQQEKYENATRVVSPESGTVYEVSIAKGSYISPGSTIAVIEPFSSNGSTLEATMFFAGKDGKRIKPGMTIDISPSTVKQEEYGYIQGIVTSVSKFPATPQHIQTTFQNQSLTEVFSHLEAPIEIKVRLIPDSKTVSGYKWSSSKGPDGTLETGILCTGAVTVTERKPIELVIPLIKKSAFGIGE